MIDYNKYIGKKVFIITLKNNKYSGEVIGVDDRDPILTFIEIKDKFGEDIIFCVSELAKFQVVRE